MKTKLEVGDKLYFISQSGFISIEPITRIKEDIAYSGGVSFELDITNGEVKVIKNTGVQGEFHLPMRELEQMYQDQQIRSEFNSQIAKLKKIGLSLDQMKRILPILSE